MTKVTLKDLAVESGFAVSTVSAVLRGQGDLYHIAASTQKDIKETAQRMEYRKNLMAKSLRAGQSNFVAILDTSYNTPIRQLRQRLIAQRLKNLGFQILVYDFHWMEEEQKKLLYELEEIPVSGLIMDATDAAAALEYAQRFIKRQLLVLLDTGYIRGIDQVLLNRRSLSYAMAKHLLNLGYRDIYYTIGIHSAYWPIVERRKGFEKALKEYGVPAGEDRYIWDDEKADAYHRGYTLGKKIIFSKKSLPDAVMALNDHIAIGIMKAFHEQGISIPDDVALVGAEDLPESEFAQVRLTTMDFKIDVMAGKAVEIFLKRLKGDMRDFPRRVVIEPSLIVRESCGKHKIQGGV